MKHTFDVPEVEEVTLPKLFHLRPGYYILVILIVCIFLAVFFIAFFPGIRKGGRYITFTSVLSESGVLVDGTYLGSTEYQYFVPSGNHQITLQKGGVSYASYPLVVDHPVFLTYFVHRTMTSKVAKLSLDETQKLQIMRFNLEEIQKESAILSYDAVTLQQPLFENLINDLLALNVEKQVFNQYMTMALEYISNPNMLQEAQSALQKHAITLSAEQQGILDGAVSLFAKTDAASMVGEQSQDISVAIQSTQLRFENQVINGYAYPQADFVMGTSVKNTYPQTNEAGVRVSVGPFSLATNEVSQYEWALFVKENPQWDKANRDALIQKGLVDAYYLEGISVSTVFVTSRPVTNVSYYAAQAYCDWLSKKTGKQVFLPTEAMWTLAALNQKDVAYQQSLSPAPLPPTSPQALFGGVWEMTQTPYLPLSRISRNYAATLSLHDQLGLSKQVIVKGGSYLNKPNTITAHTVGVIEPDACGDQIGFRIAWYE
jgi:hypothetical protein